jgi:hypothetical protein
VINTVVDASLLILFCPFTLPHLCHFFDFDQQQASEEAYLKQICILQFGQLHDVVGFGKLLRMCVASLVYHRDWFNVHLHHNHVFLQTTSFLCNLFFIDQMSPMVNITYPWKNIYHTFSGVPPHTSLLQEIQSIKIDQRDLIIIFVSKSTSL